MNLYLYDNFIKSDMFVSERGDGGPELFNEMIKHIKQVKDQKILEEIYNEIEIWIKVGAPSYFVMGVNLAGALHLTQFKDLLVEKREGILKGHHPDFKPYYAITVEDALKLFDEA